MNNNFFSRFVPQTNEYFLLLTQMADAMCTTADLTYACTQAASQEDIARLTAQIREQKHLGLKIQGKITRELHNSFITPFDREDINNLTLNMRSVINHISSCAKRIMRYSPKYMPDAAKSMAGMLKESTGLIKTIMEKMPQLKKKPQNLTHLCKQIESLEGKSDEVYENYLIELFKNEKDAIEIIKLKDILYELEHAMDATEAVGKIVSTIVVKYA